MKESEWLLVSFRRPCNVGAGRGIVFGAVGLSAGEERRCDCILEIQNHMSTDHEVEPYE